MDRLARLLGARRLAGRDGTAPALEAAATAIPATLLDAAPALAAPALAAPPPPGGQAMLREAVLAKVLHGWLQNRHQVLFPLAVNLATLDPQRRETVARITAVALLADTPAHDEREARARRWLAAAGADPATLAALDAALADPPATSRTLDAVAAQDLAPYAYVAALVALDTRDAAGLHFTEYLAARLALPATLVRSANRRYRR
ncbi:MAG: hypothetical protein ACRYG6_03645 [Janthinobacterium lividum]